MLLLRGATRRRPLVRTIVAVSIHAPLARSNSPMVNTVFDETGFQYMLLLRGATESFAVREIEFGVSIHAPLARSNRMFTALNLTGDNVSIHAPLARSNMTRAILRNRRSRFNTCSSCEEQLQELYGSTGKAFQYMLLLRGATSGTADFERGRRGFNTCSSCEEQLPHKLELVGAQNEFQYMLLLRGATIRHCVSVRSLNVSIHAPLARSNRLSSIQSPP